MFGSPSRLAGTDEDTSDGTSDAVDASSSEFSSATSWCKSSTNEIRSFEDDCDDSCVGDDLSWW